MRPLLFASLIVLTGCSTGARKGTTPTAADLAGLAARERYRAIQDAHRPAPPPGEFELIPIRRPERSEDGILRIESIEHLRVPRIP
jgi:hypothetical protein